MHIFLKINKDASVVDLIDRITDIKDVGFQKFQEKTEIVLYQTGQGIVRGIFDVEFKLDKYKI